MTASHAPRSPPPRRRESPLSFWCLAGILLVALVLLLPTCSGKSCPHLGELLNGEIVYVNGTTEFGSQAHFECKDGYYLLGTHVLYCQLFGNNVAWSDYPSLCEKILCQPPEIISNGKYTNSHKDKFEYNEVVTYSCNPSNGSDEYSLVGQSRLFCSGNDQWSSNPPECKVVKCQYPELRNGRMVSGLGGKFYYKSKVTFECLKGFYLEGHRTVVCGVNSNWVPKIPECINNTKDACGDPPTFKSMKLQGNPAPLYTPGDKVGYKCRPGYRRLVPVLPTSAVCQPDDTWTPLQEACTEKSCPQLGEPQNGQIFYTHGTSQFGSQAHYVCNEDYKLIGTKILYCNLSGNNVKWSDSPPRCKMSTPPSTKPTISRFSGVVKWDAFKALRFTASFREEEAYILEEEGIFPVKDLLNLGDFKHISPAQLQGSSVQGHFTPSSEPTPEDSKKFDEGIIALTVLTSILAIAVVGTNVYKYLRVRKKE